MSRLFAVSGLEKAFFSSELFWANRWVCSGTAEAITEYGELPDDQRKGMATFTDKQKADVQKYLEMLMDICVETKVFVDDDEDGKVYEGNLCSVRVTVTRNNLKQGEKAGLVHAPHFPYPKQEAWWIILGTKEGKIINIKKIPNPNRTFAHNIKYLAPRVGQDEFDLYVKLNVYVGLDHI